MDLMRNYDTGVVHRTGCARPGADRSVHWTYGDPVPDEAALGEQTVKFPRMHLCTFCLKGVCRCRQCSQKAAAGA